MKAAEGGEGEGEGGEGGEEGERGGEVVGKIDPGCIFSGVHRCVEFLWSKKIRIKEGP